MAPWISAIRVPSRGSLYYRYFRQNVDNGNAPNDTPCTDDNLAGLLCTGSGVSTTFVGVPITDLPGTSAHNAGESICKGPARMLTAPRSNSPTPTERRVFSGWIKTTSSRVLPCGRGARGFNGAWYVLGGLTTDSRTFQGSGIVIDEPGQNSPVSVGITTSTWGVYFAPEHTLKLTDHLTATVSGRLNAAYVEFDRFQGRRPRRRLLPSHSAFQSCGRPHLRCRALANGLWWLCHGQPGTDPSGAELLLGRADYCSLANFFVGDPDPQQPVAQENLPFEAGLRGNVSSGKEQTCATASASSLPISTTISPCLVNSPIQGRALFSPMSAQRGVRALRPICSTSTSEHWRARSLHYALVDATFQSGLVTS